MDDGSRVNTGFHLNTNGFERAHVEILTNVLFNKFNLNCSSPEQSRYRIYILKNSMPQLISIIEPYIIPSMLYKIKPTQIN
jgi:LAGLIDADG DNA endonuclease family